MQTKQNELYAHIQAKTKTETENKNNKKTASKLVSDRVRQFKAALTTLQQQH